jgi:hypothetical protein
MRTLFVDRPIELTARDERLFKISKDWQLMGAHADVAEMHAAINAHHVAEGRPTEIIGRIAAAGEQLGLSATFGLDARRWLESPAQVGTMPARALTETQGSYALSTGHALINITLRVLLLQPTAAALLNGRFNAAQGFPPFVDLKEVWPPLSTKSVQAALDAAVASGGRDVLELAHVVRRLKEDVRWNALDERRGQAYHRWRPQSVSGGVAARSPWKTDGASRSMEIGLLSDYEPPNARLLMAECESALEALAGAMEAWLDRLPGALRDVGLPVFRIDA